MSIHKDLTGADLHEPKGADTATSGKVYVSDGAGSGVWTAASSVISNTAWSTGDLKFTWKSTADDTWIMGSAGSIGDGSSSATIRANADCEDLFLFIYSWFVDVNAPVSGGRGASAAADWAAHKRITLPDMWGRAVGLAGAGSGLTSRTFYTKTGTETHTITRANLPNTSVTVTVTDPGHDHIERGDGNGGIGNQMVLALGNGSNSASASTTSSSTTGITAAFNLNGSVSQTTVSLMQPTVFLNIMIKL